MSTEAEGRARLIALYDGKAAEAERRAALLRDRLPTITDDAERKLAHYQITRQAGVAEENREKAARLRPLGSPAPQVFG
jgi:hypothetical protein